MKRNYKTEKHKEFLRLERESHANWEAQRKLGYKPLDKPIHHGYKAFWVLRDDVARRQDADQWQYILDTFGKSTWCKDKSFKHWDRTKKMMTDIRPSFKDIDKDKYDALPTWAKKFFYQTEKRIWYGMCKVYVVSIPDYFLKMKIVKSYKTHYKVIDEILLQEEAELESRLDGQFYDERRNNWRRHRSKKKWRKIFSKADRSHNKMALRKNMGTIYAKYDDINDDWSSWLSGWCDDFAEFKYYHNHYGRWWF